MNTQKLIAVAAVLLGLIVTVMALTADQPVITVTAACATVLTAVSHTWKGGKSDH